MNPDSLQQNTSGGDGNNGGAPQPPASQPQQPQQTSAQREAAASIVRQQIDSLYGAQQVQQRAQDDQNPYDRHYEEGIAEPQADQWKAYHTAWQTYYQKYYEGYYQQQKQAEAEKTPKQHFFGSQPAAEPEPAAEEIVTKEEALEDLRHQLLQKVQTSAKKVRRSRHFIPISAAILVVLIFVFLQYNSFITGTVMAYVSPGTLSQQNIVIDPSDTTAINSSPTLIIPKINVDVPMIMGVKNDYNDLMAAMQKGVTEFSIPGADALPGQVGNAVFAGHSSNDLFDPGDYKFIFAQLEKMAVGDTFYADYQGTRYTYVVTKVQVVAPTDVSALVYPTTKPTMTLITCTPLGTSKNRLLVVGEQVSPDPSTAKAANTSTSSGAATTIPGANAPSLLQKLFGAGG